MSFAIALSGLNAATTDLEVTGNNIANANTNGFKEARVEYADVYANSLQDLSATASGRGVKVAAVAQQFSQGSVDFTSNNLDLAINGEGFFVVEDRNGSRQYTRAGAYSADRDGYVVNSVGDRLQVYPTSSGTDGVTRFSTGEDSLTALQLPLVSNSPTASTRVGSQLNLNANSSQPLVPFDPAVRDPISYNYSTSLTLYDSQGASHTGTMYFVKDAAPNDWSAYFQVDGTNVTVGGADFTTLTFGPNGALTSPITGRIALDPVSLDTATTDVDDLTITWDLTDSTQFGAAFAVNELDQDGFSTGRLSGVDIDNEGVVFARYTNGESSIMGKVAVAGFNNSQGLRSIGGTKWVETFASGTVRFGEAGAGSFGLMQSGALESSNVDIATELVDLIIAQRNFQANAKVISTSDQVTQAVINIR
jgi:flagellar hook protein FlgE